MTAEETPWSTHVTVLDTGQVRVSILLTADPGPVREFHPFLDVDLDEAHAAELLGGLAIALSDLRARPRLRLVDPS